MNRSLVPALSVATLAIVALTSVTLCPPRVVAPACQSASAAAGRDSVRKNDTAVLEVPGGRIDVYFDGGGFGLAKQSYVHWLRTAANAVSSYYGRFPVAHLIVRLSSTSGDTVDFATTTYEDDGGLIEIPIGSRISDPALQDDWTAAHEMTHLAFPLMNNRDKWLAEGQATYVEPLARLRVGDYTAEHLWRDLVTNLPEGLPRGDGLSYSTDWGRVYWGGALFCLIADIEIRQQTGNRKGLQDALSAVAAAGGNITSDWSSEKSLAIGDRATGVNVLVPLFRRMSKEPHSVDLPDLWRKLGVRLQNNGKVAFDNNAPMAAVRLSIEKGLRSD